MNTASFSDSKHINYFSRLRDFSSLEEVLCATVLLTHGVISQDGSLTGQEQDYYNREQDCDKCPFCNNCLAFILNA